MRVPLIDFAIPVYVVRELIWFLLHGQYIIIARYDLFSSYKINQTARQPFDVQWFMFDAMNLDHLVSMPILLAISIYSWRAIKVNLDFNTVPSPLALFGMLVLSRFVREFLRYWGHRFLHMGLLYKLIHKKHHEYTSPFSLVGEYAHPVENIVHGIIPIVAGMFTLAYSFGELHIVTLYLDLLWMTVISVEEHTGYMLPWNADYWRALSWISGGSIHHDLHHKELHGNYGERFFDWIFGTDFETMRAKRMERLAAARKGNHGDDGKGKVA